MTIPDVLQNVVDVLKGVGIDATTDPRSLNPPCAWVVARSISHEYLCGDYSMKVDIYLIAPNTGVPQALSTLSGMLDSALSVLVPDSDTSLSEAVTIPGGGDPMPAFKITIETSGE